METYTDNLEAQIWILAEELDKNNEDVSSTISFLNSTDGFQSFGTRLSIFIAKKLSISSNNSKNLIFALKEQCKKCGMELDEIGSYNTLRNWFEKDMRPKKGTYSRNSMFALAFALKLSINETKKLFHRIYLDRAFNYRNEKEVIYYFCLKNGESWADAARLIAAVGDLSKDYSDNTQYTHVISSSVDSFKAEQDLLEYIRRNGHNFEKSSVTTSRIFNRYLSEAKKLVKDEISQYDLDHQNKWVNNLSNNTLYEIITGLNITGKKGTITVFSNADLPKEIRSRFPEAATFGENGLTPEEYRKAIILLFSYCFWYHVQRGDIDGGIDDFTDELNNVLFDCNYSGLYYGNPFDWMFLFCAQSELPLDLFRELLSEVFE